MLDWIDDVLMGIIRLLLALVLGTVLVAGCVLLARWYVWISELLWNWGR